MKGQNPALPYPNRRLYNNNYNRFKLIKIIYDPYKDYKFNYIILLNYLIYFIGFYVEYSDFISK